MVVPEGRPEPRGPVHRPLSVETLPDASRGPEDMGLGGELPAAGGAGAGRGKSAGGMTSALRLSGAGGTLSVSLRCLFTTFCEKTWWNLPDKAMRRGRAEWSVGGCKPPLMFMISSFSL